MYSLIPDPTLAGLMAEAWVNGVQSQKVMTSESTALHLDLNADGSSSSKAYIALHVDRHHTTLMSRFCRKRAGVSSTKQQLGH
jgi:hypothetical protein